MKLSTLTCTLILLGSALTLVADEVDLSVITAPAAPELPDTSRRTLIRSVVKPSVSSRKPTTNPVAPSPRDIAPILEKETARTAPPVAESKARPSSPSTKRPAKSTPRSTVDPLPRVQKPLQPKVQASTAVGSGVVANHPKASSTSLIAQLHLQPGAPSAVKPQEQESEVSFDSAVPNLRATTVGPNTLVVGRSDRYIITLRNESDFEARSIDVRCSIPEWVRLDDQRTTDGNTSQPDSVLIWNVSSVPARGTQRLELALTPTAARAFELNVDIAVRPTQTRKMISIQEPKLAVDFIGPNDAVFGQPSTWQLRVGNPGTGTVNDVALTVFAGTRELGKVEIGSIAAGASRTAVLEVTATEIGTHSLRAMVTGQHELSDSADTSFLVRRGKLSVDVSGSRLDYAGSVPLYNVTLKNTGNAPVNRVLMNISIPEGMEYVSGIPSPSMNVGGVSWVVESLNVDEQVNYPVRLKLDGGGRHPISIVAETADKLSDTASIVTESLTSADLKLEVHDAPGPRPVGATDEYEIHVTNRGTAVARDIRVVAVCAPEVEPVDVTGNAAIKSGQVFFRPIAEMEPGYKMVFKLRVRAQSPGTHAFRVVVNSFEPELRLAMEESTTYFDKTTGAIGPVSSEDQSRETVSQRQGQNASR